MSETDALTHISNFCDIIKVANRQEWLKLRRTGIGGSDVAGILGISRFKTPLDIYNDKLSSEDPEEITNKAIEFGNDCEDALVSIFRAKYKDRYEVFLLKDYLFRNKQHPFLLASIDGFLYDKLLKCWGVLEIKTKQDRYTGWENFGVPDEYMTQGMHYNIVLPISFVTYLGAINYNFDNGQDTAVKILQPRTFFENDWYADMKNQLNMCGIFWENIKNRKPPVMQMRF